MDKQQDLLKETADFIEKEEKAIAHSEPVRAAGKYWKTLGPGLTAGAADDDPSGIAAYSQAGARYGSQLLWLPLFTFPLMAVVQEMCARIGLVSGEGLAANIRRHYPAAILYGVTALLFFANTLNIAADLGAMAAATQLLLPDFSLEILVVVFGVVSLLLQIFTSYERYAAFLKYLTLTLLSYVVVAFSVNLDWSDLLKHTFIPSITFSKDQLLIICAVLGTTISPYLFFWQTSQEVEEGILHGQTSIAARQEGLSKKVLRTMRIDVWSGMFFSNLIMFFIFAAAAGTLFGSGITNITTVAQAAEALRPFGEYAHLLFALGVIGTGLIAVPVFAGSAAYALAESFKWRYGLYRTFKQAHAFYGVIIVSMGIGIAANFLGLDPIQGLIYAAVVNGIIAPFLLYFIVRLSGNKSIMGEYANHPFIAGIGWLTIGLMALSGIAAIASFWWV